MTLNGNKLNIKQKILTISSVFLTVVFILTYFFIFASINNIKDLRINIINQKLDEEKKISKEKNMSALNEKLKKIEPELEKVNEIFLAHDRELEFITTMEGLASKNGVIQKIDLNTDSVTNMQQIKKIPITITVTGSFNNFNKYLSELENLRYYINVNAINLSSANNGNANQNSSSGNNSVTAQISALTYWK
jgi:Tfp pilus assembly protein PilO